MAIYTFGSSFFYHPPHLEREEVFGSAKRIANCPPSVKNDFHNLDCMNFFHPQIIIFVVQPNVVKNVGMQQPPYGSSACSPLVSQSGLELKENICVDGQWWIECCPPSSNV
jgi:hypothetical protein